MSRQHQNRTRATEQLLSFLKSHPDNVEKIVKTELLYYRDTHKSYVIATLSLFKVRNINYNEKLTNLSILLDGHTSFNPPENKDALERFSEQTLLETMNK